MEAPKRHQVFEIQSESSYLRPLRQDVSRFLEEAGVGRKDLETLLIALGEACTNSIRHSYGGEPGKPIRVEVEARGSEVLMRIRDFGKKIDLEAVPEAKVPPEKPGGLGLYFMRTMMDEMRYNTTHPEGNELILTKKIQRA